MLSRPIWKSIAALSIRIAECLDELVDRLRPVGCSVEDRLELSHALLDLTGTK